MAIGIGRNLKEWFQPLIDAGVIPATTRRIIIDIPCNDVVMVYYECEADERMFTVSLGEMLKGAKAIGIAELSQREDKK